MAREAFERRHHHNPKCRIYSPWSAAAPLPKQLPLKEIAVGAVWVLVGTENLKWNCSSLPRPYPYELEAGRHASASSQRDVK